MVDPRLLGNETNRARRLTPSSGLGILDVVFFFPGMFLEPPMPPRLLLGNASDISPLSEKEGEGARHGRRGEKERLSGCHPAGRKPTKGKTTLASPRYSPAVRAG